MGMGNENRQCVVCAQIVEVEQKTVVLKQRPENRIVHVSCAVSVTKALVDQHGADPVTGPALTRIFMGLSSGK